MITWKWTPWWSGQP